MSQQSIAESQDRMTEVMIKHMCRGHYNIVKVLKSIGEPTPEKLLSFILQNERDNEKKLMDLKEKLEDADERLEEAQERLEEAVDEAVEEKDELIEELEEENKKLKEKTIIYSILDDTYKEMSINKKQWIDCNWKSIITGFAETLESQVPEDEEEETEEMKELLKENEDLKKKILAQ